VAKCTNYRTNENGDVVGMCGEPATVVYEKPNPEKGPNQPKVIDFPRCPTHDNSTVRAAALEQGYRREVIDE
jgi:hypothetical protein